MKKTFPYDDDTKSEGIFEPRTNAGNWTDAGDNFPLAVFAGTATSGTTGNATAAATIPQLADWLVNGFWSYDGTNAHHWASTTISYNINGLNAAEKFLAQSAMQAWHEVANVTFVQTSGSANITFVDSGSMTAVTSANWTSSGITTSATVDISSDWITNDGGAMDGKTGIDSYGYQTYIHEIGHALGLGHQGPYNGSADYSTNAIFANDTWQYSIMSYFSENNYSGSTYRYVVTPQMADIYAVDQIYGVASTRTGNTTYGFHSNAGSIFDFTQYSPAPALTIYDSGGNDTLDCSGYSSSQTIDLHPGAFSSVGGLVHNIGISTSTVIENAIGGNGNDTLIANDLGCTLSGGAGNDTLIGGAGNDRLIGGIGADRMTGGGGTDNFVFVAGDSTSSQPDLITDFISGVDTIDLSAFDAIVATSAIDQFYFVGTGAFNGTAGVLDYFYNSSLGITVLQGDTNGDNVADFVLDLTGNIALSLANLIGAYATPIVVESFGSTKLVQIGNEYDLENSSTGIGPALKFSGAPVTVGMWTGWAPVGAEQTSTGYDVAFRNASTGLFNVWSTDTNGNYITNLASGISGTSTTLENFEAIFHQDLNGDGTIGPPPPPPSTVVEAFGVTSLVQSGPDYFLNPVGGGTGPELFFNGAPVTVGMWTGWAPVGAEQTSSGYDVAFHNASTGLFNIWSTDTNGNYITNLASGISGTSTTLENFETIFHQDLNGNGTIGPATSPPPPSSTVVEAFGVTSLVQSGSDYFLNPAGGGTGPELYFSGAPVTVGMWTGWAPIGAEQTSSGYDVAFRNASTGLFNVWSTDTNGNYITNLASGISGTSTTLENFETIFHQDLNGDGTIGPPSPPSSTVVEALGVTSLVQSGSDYFLNPAGGGTGPELYFSGAPVTVGMWTGWAPIGAEQTSSGYDVAFRNASTGLFNIWSTDTNGNYITNLASGISGTSTTLENFEAIFHQDLNGDGTIGLASPPSSTVVEAFGVTSLVQSGSDYFLNPADGGTGPELFFNGAPVTVGMWTGWAPVGAEQTSSGYDVAFHNASTGLFNIWSTDTNGNYITNLASGISGTSTTLENFETIFHQDLNGDGVIGVNAPTLPATPQAPSTQNDAFTFIADLGAGSGNSSAPLTFEFNGAAAAAAGHQLASLFDSTVAETQYLQHLVTGDHDAVAYFANLEGASPADIQVTQTQHGFIIH